MCPRAMLERKWQRKYIYWGLLLLFSPIIYDYWYRKMWKNEFCRSKDTQTSLSIHPYSSPLEVDFILIYITAIQVHCFPKRNAGNICDKSQLLLYIYLSTKSSKLAIPLSDLPKPLHKMSHVRNMFLKSVVYLLYLHMIHRFLKPSYHIIISKFLNDKVLL